MNWLQDTFGVDKPVIGMCHLPALPGDPGYDSAAGVDFIVRRAAEELAALQEGGVNGILISNEFSLPYLTKTEPITAITMARVIGELRSMIEVPFGVNVLWDGTASVDLAVATGARFVREIFSGVYASDFGLWNTNVGALARHRAAIGAHDVRLLFNIVPEAASYLGHRTLADIARSTVFNCQPDGVCVSGLTAGSSTDVSHLRTVKGMAGETPVIVNTGVKAENVAALLEIADAAIIGTYFKQDGKFENPADPRRVKELMDNARTVQAAATHG